MSYGFPEKQQSRPRGGGGRFFFFIILAVGAFILFSNRLGPVKNGDQGNGQKIPGRLDPYSDDERQITMDDLLENKSNSSKSSSNDWSMDEVETTDGSSRRTNPIVGTENKSTQKGDWSLDEVDTNPKPKSDGFKFSDPTNNQAAPKKTQKGDWEIEEGKGSDNN